jgi:predicted DNA-binding protein with PD1-like motif
MNPNKHFGYVTPLEHPGPKQPQRRTSVETLSRPTVVALPGGQALIDAVAVALSDLGVTSAQVELLDGTFTRLSYCYPALPEDREAVVWFSATEEAVTPARLVGGSMTVGFRNDRRYFHCHAAWLDADGEVRGGHVWPETAIGPGPVYAVVHALDAVDTMSATDPESTLPVFTPQPRKSHGLSGPGTRRAVMSRLAPGVEFTAAVGEIMNQHGFAKASVAGSVGSLVGAVLHGPRGDVMVDGPATEVSFAGVVHAANLSEPCVTVIAVDLHARAHTGLLVPGENLIAVTAELLVEEVTS